LFHEEFSDASGACEGDLFNNRRCSENFAYFGGVLECADNIDDAFGDAGSVGELGESERGEGRFARRFSYYRAASCEGGADFAGYHCGGEIPSSFDISMWL
jgi:hypothetical protein